MNYLHALYQSVSTLDAPIDPLSVDPFSNSISDKAAFFFGRFSQKDTLVVTVGDSFTWGQDLPTDQRLELVFGNCLAKSLDADWLNVAQVGASNSWILRYASQVIDLLANDTQYKKIYFIVTLTESGREVGLDCEYDPSWEKYNISDPLLYDNILEDLEHSWCDKIHTIQQKLDSRYWFYIGQNFAWHQGVDQTCRDLEINASDNTWVELIYRAKGIEMPCRSNIVTQFAFYEFSSCNKKLSITDLSKYKSWSICKIDEANSVLSWMEDHGWIHPEPKRFHPYIDGHQIWFNHIADKINATKSSY